MMVQLQNGKHWHEDFKHWQHYGKCRNGDDVPDKIEPVDTRPLTHEHWPAFVAWVVTTPGVRNDVISLPGFEAAGYILWQAYLAGGECDAVP